MKLTAKASSGLRLMFAASLLITALIAFLSANRTLGWFSANDQVNAQGMEVAVQDSNDIIDNIYYYPIDSVSLDANKNNVYHFSKVAAEGDDIKLLPFSSVEAKRQILIQIVLKPEVSGAHILATTNTTEYITEGTPAATGNPLSSIVELSVIDPSDIDKSGNKYVISETAKVAQCFATVTTSNGLTADISFNKSLDLGRYENVDSIFILVDYNEQSARYAMSVINNLMMSGQLTVSDDEVGFDCDFEFQVNPIQ